MLTSSNGSGGSNSRKTVDHNTQHQQQQEDDGLPEELKRYGKELVEQIENEIMENGDKITFDDIAGLKDQKQIVQEVVCWPLKRPDLFTGLRSAPNGLLLYGPPGTGAFARGEEKCGLFVNCIFSHLAIDASVCPCNRQNTCW